MWNGFPQNRIVPHEKQFVGVWKKLSNKKTPPVGGIRSLSSVSEEIVHLIHLGSQATDQDYLQIGKELDHFSLKSLVELRSMVPIAIQDMIALQWAGDEDELAQMYRWYLRGLPPEMSVRRVELERQSYEIPADERLPWEGQLIGARETLPHDSANLQLSFISLGDNVNLENLENLESQENGTIERREVNAEKVDPYSVSVSPLDTLGSMFAFPVSEDNVPSISLFFSLVPDPFAEEEPPSIESAAIYDRNRDTLPLGDHVQQVITIIMHFSEEKKWLLCMNLSKFPI